MALPLVLAALLPIMILPGDEHEVIAATVAIVSWLVFVVDFVVHERRLTRYLSTWMGRFDLAVVVLTAPWFLLTGPTDSKFVLLIRLARIARLVVAGSGARRLFQQIGRVAIVAVAVVFIGAALVYRAEHATNPGFATYGDALWWAVVTLTTVGYGDIVPKTDAGRIIAVMIMVTGVAVLGVLAGSLAGFFGLGNRETDRAPTPAPEPDLRAEIVDLRESVATLAEHVSQLVARRGGDAPPPR